KRQWTATDACGNTAEVETVIWVNPDIEGPVFTFVPEGDLITCDEFPPTFGEPEVEDACGSVTLTFEDQFIGDPNGCDIGESFDFRRVWTATDECGNETTAKQTFWVKPSGITTGTLAGSIVTEENDGMGDIEISIDGDAVSTMAMTDASGHYDVDLPAGFNYEIEPYYNEDPLNGISTMDLILMSKHILGMELLDSPYKMIAADVNNSGQITGFDLVELRKLILFIDTEFQNNTSWRFIDADFVFPDPGNPFATTFPEMVSINGLSASELANFVGVKTGDVNGSNLMMMGGDTRSANALQLAIMDQKLKAGNEYAIDVKANNFTEISGYQFTLNFAAQGLDFVDVKAADLPHLNTDNFAFHRINEGIITTSWHQETAMSIDAEEILFTLVFKAKAEVQLSDVLSISSQYTKAEAYNAFNEAMEMQLDFGAGIGQNEKFVLYQNRPNPFKGQTLIQFNLPQASNGILTISDIAGRTIKLIEGDFSVGYNELVIDQSDLNGAGVYFYRLETADHSAVKKMILH
ncbi:MAG: T9SS type A sorting domain-containing protein, partial [Bacteroidota bacterium]